MARKLNKKDISLLKDYIGIVFDYDELPDKVQTVLDTINSYECKWSDVNRHLRDISMNKNKGAYYKGGYNYGIQK